ncbi:MAG TPA: carbon-nitrogen hydrolase family protein [Marinobacterium sp.]|nr:carbon-nitrogen hydrolase family protein [Marinobacterium sp.]
MNRVALVQMVSGADPDINLRQAEEGIGIAKGQGAHLVILPENFLLFDSANLIKYAHSEQADQALKRLTAVAKYHSIWVVAGSFPAPAPNGRAFARSIVINDSGAIVSQYDKRHLFDVDVADAKGSYRESDWIAPGDALSVVNTPIGDLGLSICYDLRFPIHFQRLRDAGAQLISVPSAFTQVTGAAHWEILLRARAIETQCYLIGAGQAGDHGNGRFTYGHSLILDPWGEIIASAKPQGFDVISAEVDLVRLQQIRQRMPVSRQRRDQTAT